jgi:hypothetical protein
VGEGKRRAFFQIRLKNVAVQVRLVFVGHEDHDDVGIGDRLGRVKNLEACCFCLFGGGGAVTEADNDTFHAAVFHVLGMSMALRAVTDDGDFFVLDQVFVCVFIVVDFQRRVVSWG